MQRNTISSLTSIWKSTLMDKANALHHFQCYSKAFQSALLHFRFMLLQHPPLHRLVRNSSRVFGEVLHTYACVLSYSSTSHISWNLPAARSNSTTSCLGYCKSVTRSFPDSDQARVQKRSCRILKVCISPRVH